MKRKKEKIIRMIKYLTDGFLFVCLNWAFPKRYTYPLLTLFDT